jgi:hypothetical protein
MNPTTSGMCSQATGIMAFFVMAGIRTPVSVFLTIFPLSPQIGITTLETDLHFLLRWYLVIKLLLTTQGIVL